MVYKYLGYGVTDSNGVAKLDHDAEGQELQHSYTGVGAGEVDVLASLDNPIESGSIVSEPYEVLDTIFYDDGMENTHNTNWANPSSLGVAYSDDGTTISYTANSASRYYNSKISDATSWRDTNTNYCIELDYDYTNGSGGSANVQFGGATIELYRLGSVAGTKHLKIITDGNNLYPYLNDTHISAQDKTMSSNYGFSFAIYRTASLTFKNLKIYII